MISGLGLPPLRILVVSCCLRQGEIDGYLRLACWSHSADSRMSASLIVPFELEYMN